MMSFTTRDRRSRMRREQAGEGDRGREMDGGGNALGKHGHHAAADGLFLQIGDIDFLSNGP